MLRLELRPSLQLAALLACLYGGAVACVLIVPVAVWIHALAVAALSASGIHAVLLHARCALPASIRMLEMDENCACQLVDARGSRTDARLLPSSVVLPWLTVLAFSTASGRRRTLLLVPDRVDADAYRRLRVLLRWRCRFGTDSGMFL